MADLAPLNPSTATDSIDPTTRISPAYGRSGASALTQRSGCPPIRQLSTKNSLALMVNTADSAQQTVGLLVGSNITILRLQKNTVETFDADQIALNPKVDAFQAMVKPTQTPRRAFWSEIAPPIRRSAAVLQGSTDRSRIAPAFDAAGNFKAVCARFHHRTSPSVRLILIPNLFKAGPSQRSLLRLRQIALCPVTFVQITGRPSIMA